jgi:hypothetical protein
MLNQFFAKSQDSLNALKYIVSYIFLFNNLASGDVNPTLSNANTSANPCVPIPKALCSKPPYVLL